MNEPQKPCIHAEYLNEVPCCGSNWKCHNSNSPAFDKERVTGNYCSTFCPCGEKNEI